LKFGTFSPAYFLFMLVVSSVRDIQNLLKQIADGRREFLEHGGVVKAISSSIKADRVSLSIKLPGDARNRIANFVHLHSLKEDNPHETQDSHRKPFITELSKLGSQAAKDVLITGQPSIAEQVSAFPVIFHGAVIGCLEACLSNNKFSETDIAELEDMAMFVSPAVYAYRELASLDQISYRIARLQFGRVKLPADKALENVITILQDTLSPLGMEIYWDIGFNSDNANKSRESELDVPETQNEEIHAGDGILPIKNDLILTLRKDIEWDDDIHLANNIFFAHAGKITFWIPESKDHPLQPTLVTNYLHRRAISNITVDGLLDLSRDYFNSVLQDFGVVLNQHRPANFQNLCQAIDHTARQAGLFWTAVTWGSSNDLSYFSSSEAAEIVRRLQGEQQSQGVSGNVTSLELKPTIGDTHHVIRIHLENAEQEMWFGVKRKGFGVELEFVSPWYVFLKQFAEIANAAMLRITASRDLQRLQIENIRQQGMAKSATNANILAHDLKNYSGGVHNTLSFIKKSLTRNRITIEEEYAVMITDSLNSALNSAKKINDITKIITLERKLDDHQPCSLTRAVNHVVGLRGDDFSPDNIGLKAEVKGDHEIDIPYYVATVAIDNLVTNARNAIVKYNGGSGQGQGRIFISVDKDKEEGFVTCYVKDDGPGIPEAFRERIREFGYTTNWDSGG
jgi:signal transduction histidine kinase